MAEPTRREIQTVSETTGERITLVETRVPLGEPEVRWHTKELHRPATRIEPGRYQLDDGTILVEVEE